MKKLNLILLALIIIGMAACAKPPTDEMNRAHDAVIRAESDVNAVNYAGNSLVRARDALARMESEAEAKRYDAAKNFAAEAISAAEKAIADGKTGADRAKDEAVNLLNSLPGPLAETSDALSAAEQLHNINLDFDRLFEDLDMANETYDSARVSLAGNNYNDAINKGHSVRVVLGEINASLSEAVQAISRKQ